MVYTHFAQNSGKVACNLLGSGTDYDIIRTGVYSTGTVNVPGNFIAQGRLSLGVALKKQQLGVIIKNSGRTFFPLGEVKTVKVIKIRRFLKSVVAEGIGSSRFVSGTCTRIRSDVCYIIPGLRSAGYISFHQKLVIGLAGGCHAYAQLSGKAAQRRKFFSGSHNAAENVCLDCFI